MAAADVYAEVVLCRGSTELVRWALAAADGPDLPLVDALARLQLAASRIGWSVRLDHAASGLVELLELTGLAGLFSELEAFDRRSQSR